MRALKRQVAASALLAGLFCVAVAAANAAPPISSKQAEAQRVLGQLQQLDASAQLANGRFELASRKLQRVEEQLSVNKQALGVAHVNLVSAQHALAQRLVEIYTSQDEQSSLAVILGAKSLDDLISRIETMNTVTKQNTALIRQVTNYQRAIVRHRKILRHARSAVHRLVAVRAAAKHSIDAKLAAEQRLYNSVRSEIAQLEAEQRARQSVEARRAEAAALAQAAQSSLENGVTVGNLPPERYSGAVSIAMRYLGVPYVWAGASPSGFDCSGLVMYVYAQLGVSLPHNAAAQWDYPNSVYVPRADLEPGDLVFFYDLGHVGIYIGNGEYIDAPYTGVDVRIESLDGSLGAYYGAKRILGP